MEVAEFDEVFLRLFPAYRERAAEVREDSRDLIDDDGWDEAHAAVNSMGWIIWQVFDNEILLPELARPVHDPDRLARIAEFLEFLCASGDPFILSALDNWVYDSVVYRGQAVLAPYLGPRSVEFFTAERS